MRSSSKRARIGACAECRLEQPISELVKCPRCKRWVCQPWLADCGIVHANGHEEGK